MKKVIKVSSKQLLDSKQTKTTNVRSKKWTSEISKRLYLRL